MMSLHFESVKRSIVFRGIFASGLSHFKKIRSSSKLLSTAFAARQGVSDLDVHGDLSRYTDLGTLKVHQKHDQKSHFELFDVALEVLVV